MSDDKPATPEENPALAFAVQWSWVLGLVGFLCLVTFGSMLFVTQGETSNTTNAFGIASAVFFVLYAALDRERIGGAVNTRSFLYGSGSFLIVVMSVGVAVFGYIVADRHDETWDLTSDKKHTLSAQTIKVANGLEGPVEMVAFFRDGSQPQRDFRDLGSKLEVASDKISVRYVDPLRNPLEARKFEIDSEFGAVVLVRGDKRKKVEGAITEESLTKHLVLFDAASEHRICWSQGHGEPGIDSVSEPTGAGTVLSQLKELNYEVTATYAMTGGIDPSCEALVVFRPIIDWFPFERESLAAYVAGGGQVFLALEPGSTPELAAEMDRYGLVVGDDLVLDTNPSNMLSGVDDPSMVVLTDKNFAPHPITQNMGAAVVLGIARSVRPKQTQDGLVPTVLLKTGPEAWAESDLEGQGMPKPDIGTDLVGEVPVMVLTEVVDPAVLNVAEPDEGEDVEAIASRISLMLTAFGVAPDKVQPTTELAELQLTDAQLAEISGALQNLFGVALEQEGEAPYAHLRTVSDITEMVLAERRNAALRDGVQVDLDKSAAKAVPSSFEPKSGGRLVVVGDADFGGNQLVTWGNNKDLFLNTVAFLVDEEEQIAERPDEGESLDITVAEGLLSALFSLFLFPAAAVGLAIFMSVRRRFL